MATSSSQTFLTKHGYWLLLIPPLFVYVLASVLFELSMHTKSVEWVTNLTTHIASQDFSPISSKLTEMKLRYIWFATVLVSLVVFLYATSLGSIIIYRSHTRKRLITVTIIGCVLIIFGLVSLMISSATSNAMYRLIYYFSFSTLQATGLYNQIFLGHVDVLLLFINTLAIIVPCILLLAAASTLAPSPKQTDDVLAHLTTQMRHLKGVINMGSALLVSGILHMSAWLRWPTGLLSDPLEQSALSGAVLAITMFWGTTFTLVLISTYGPAASYLSEQARILAEQEETIKDPQQWLQDNHFSVTLGEQLPQISAILGPVLAGPVGSFLMSHVST